METFDVFITEGSLNYPRLDAQRLLQSLRIEKGARLNLNSDLLKVEVLQIDGKLLGNGILHHVDYSMIFSRGEVYKI